MRPRISRLPKNKKKRAIRIKQMDRKENVVQPVTDYLKNLLVQEVFRRGHYAERMRSFRLINRFNVLRRGVA